MAKRAYTKHVTNCVNYILSTRRWGPKELSDEMNVSTETVRRWLNGEREPRFTQGLHLFALAGWSIDEMVGIKPEGSSKLAEQENRLLKMHLARYERIVDALTQAQEQEEKGGRPKDAPFRGSQPARERLEGSTVTMLRELADLVQEGEGEAKEDTG